MEIFNKFFFFFFLISFFFKTSFCLYANIEEIKTVDCPKKLQEILSENKIFLVEFYATWCRVSRGFANDFINIAKILKDDVTTIAIKDEDLINKYKIEAIPTIQLFFSKNNKIHIETYNGEYKIQDVVSFVYDSIKRYRLRELNIDADTHKSSYKPNSKKKNSGKVIILNDEHFSKNVLKNDDNVWFVFFYAPWCGHSKPVHAMFDELAKKVSHLKNAKIAKIDATTEQRTRQTFQINHYPSFRLFPSGNKTVYNAIDYKELRSVEDFYQFFLRYYVEKKEAIQLTSKQVFDEYCDKGTCLLALLPNKEDVEISQLKFYINVLNNVLRHVNNIPITLLWTLAGDQLELVQKLNLTFGFPTVIALSFSKNIYSILKGNYSEQSIKSFITQMMTGKVIVENLVPFNIKTVPALDLNNVDKTFNTEL